MESYHNEMLVYIVFFSYRYKMESSSGFENGSKMFDSCTSHMASDMEMKAQTRWSSEESGCMEWDTAVMAVTECGESDQNFIHQ
jgi:hypothetical protein